MGIAELSPAARENHLKIRRKKASIKKKLDYRARIDSYPKDENGKVMNPNLGNKTWVKGVSANPLGRPDGAKNVWATKCVEHLAVRSIEIVEKIIHKALDDTDKDQASMLKLCIERILPAQKAVQVTGKDGKELSIKIVVDSVEHFNSKELIEHKIIDGELVDEDDQ